MLSNGANHRFIVSFSWQDKRQKLWKERHTVWKLPTVCRVWQDALLPSVIFMDHTRLKTSPLTLLSYFSLGPKYIFQLKRLLSLSLEESSHNEYLKQNKNKNTSCWFFLQTNFLRKQFSMRISSFSWKHLNGAPFKIYHLFILEPILVSWIIPI